MLRGNPAVARLRARLDPERPAIAMAAHNPLAAKLAAATGFDAIWGSGFELSASYAVPDASILSVDTHLDLMRAIGGVQGARRCAVRGGVSSYGGNVPQARG